jgi:nitrous oxidase accessory protein NosD
VTPSPRASGEGCAATVDGQSADAVKAAVASAGAGTVCFPAGRYEGRFAADVAGQTWRLDTGTILAGSVGIVAPDVWISGGTIELSTADEWAEGVTVNADRVTIQDGTQVLDNNFSGQSGTAIFVWGEGRGADDTLIEGNTIDGSAGRNASPIASRAAENVAEGILNKRITVRGNKIDQGDATTGWFGVELKLSPGALIVDNDIRGGRVLISLPDSDGVIVSDNRLDLRASATWGVEIAKSNDVTVENNTFTGDGPDSEDTAVSMNSGSLRALISANRADGLGALVNLTGNDHMIADNCILNVKNITAYRTSAGPNVAVMRNGPCPEGATQPVSVGDRRINGRTNGFSDRAFAG